MRVLLIKPSGEITLWMGLERQAERCKLNTRA